MIRVLLIWVLDRPWAISCSASVSRWVSAPRVGGLGGRGWRAKAGISRPGTREASGGPPAAAPPAAWVGLAGGAAVSREARGAAPRGRRGVKGAGPGPG